MQNFENIGRELEKRGKADKIKQLAQSQDGMKLSQMVDANALAKAAQSGDQNTLQSILGNVLSTEEGRRLAASIQQLMQD